MDYVELNIALPEAALGEILMAELGELPFESFAEEAGRLKAYIPAVKLAECKCEADGVLERYGVQGRYVEIETRNWNELWESNFPPVDVEGAVYIRAPFHEPCGDGRPEVVIMPKMSFGTGHHATTRLMSAAVMRRDLAGRRVLDMGSGTGVLAILAAMRGAEHVDAVDIDEWAAENCAENIAVNGVAERVEPILGDVSAIGGRHYDLIVANINRNILLADMARYRAAMNRGAELLMSGILEEDVEAVRQCAEGLGLRFTGCSTSGGWAEVETVLDL